VEVVPTVHHWESYWVPRAGFALARGWFRQLDLAENAVLYDDELTPPAYRSWLRRMGIRYVLLPNAKLDTQGAEQEATLLRSGESGLVRVYRTPDWRIYELRPAVPLLTGPAPAKITALDHERISGSTSGRGVYRLRVNYTQYWRVARGRVCVGPTGDGMTALWSARPGPFVLVLSEQPIGLVTRAIGVRSAHCS
jgi:hypothetical protein